LSIGQWLALLERTREAARKKSGTNFEVEDTKAVSRSLQGFAQRLEERKRKGYEGEYKGYLPPKEEGWDGEAAAS
jgi:hypothetical protein